MRRIWPEKSEFPSRRNRMSKKLIHPRPRATAKANDPADTDPRTILQTIAADPTTPASVRVNACRLLLATPPAGAAAPDKFPRADESGWRELVGQRRPRKQD